MSKMHDTDYSDTKHEDRHIDRSQDMLTVSQLQDGGQFGHITSRLIWLTLWSALSAFAYGFSGANIGGILVQPSFGVYFNEIEHLNLINGCVSIYHAGGVFGVISSSYISDRWGRKKVFLYNTIFYVVGAAILTGAVKLSMIVVGRALMGWGAYGFIFSTQIYVIEQAPARSRGLLGAAANGIALEFGYIIAGWLSFAYMFWKNPMDNMSWRTPFILQFIPVIILVIGYPFVPESPRWLVSQGRVEEALQVLELVHGTSDDPKNLFARNECDQIVDQYALDRTLPSSWTSMFTTYRRRSLCGILIIWGYLLGGDYFLATYGPQLFIAFGYSSKRSVLFQAAWLTLLFINFFTMPFIDRIGRKKLLVFGLSGELVTLCVLCALSKYYGDGLNVAGANAFVAMFMVYMVFLCFSEPPAYLMCAEIFPLHVRTKGTAIAYATLSATNVWVLEAASTMVKKLGWKAYLLFICFTILNVTLYIVFLPETKNVTLEEMAKVFGETDQVAVGRSHNEKQEI